MNLRLLLIPLWLLCGSLLQAAIPVSGAPDFSFTDREGRDLTFHEVIASAQPGATVWLLLFDPDCNDCKAEIEELRTSPSVNAGLADATVKVVAVYPVDAPLEESDPNLPLYRRACRELPAGWVVGIDNGSIFDNDAFRWETLPLLIRYHKGADAQGSGCCGGCSGNKPSEQP